jgi:hypothetical protein
MNTLKHNLEVKAQSQCPTERTFTFIIHYSDSTAGMEWESRFGPTSVGIGGIEWLQWNTGIPSLIVSFLARLSERNMTK